MLQSAADAQPTFQRLRISLLLFLGTDSYSASLAVNEPRKALISLTMPCPT